MKDKILVLTSAAILAIFNLTQPFIAKINALEINEKKYLVEGKLVNREKLLSTLCNSSLNSINFRNPVTIGEKNIEYYCTYSNRDDALNEMTNKFNDAIQFMKQYIELPETLDSTNINELQYALNRIYEIVDEIPNRIVEQLSEIQIFLDIYDNNEVNDEIDKLISEYNLAKKNAIQTANAIRTQETLAKLDEIIPSYSENFNIISKSSIMRVGQINVSAATNYAIKYATSPNTSDYHYFNRGDCTNFASQILEASGVKQIYYESVHSGWWHTKKRALIGWTHEHSRSWTMADTFARYMGVTLSTTSLQKWSRSLSEGDFIGLDFANDGSWDHVGYVTATGSLKSYESENGQYCIPYTDIKIAQHTSNYHDWISSSKNSWETYAEKGKFSIIRG